MARVAPWRAGAVGVRLCAMSTPENDSAERCRQEIEAAESAVRDRCGFGEYLWLQDWREELRLIEASSAGKSLIAA